jgi:2-oxoglutarate dehydrogenase E2 component (dihydrolipoamide succinyltransferase)
LEKETIVVKRFINLGIAVSVEARPKEESRLSGVIVPVIHHVETLSLPALAQQIAQLAEKARMHRLSREEMQNGTLTMTNFGMAGAMLGIPILRVPEVAIVGLGAIVKKVVAMPDDSIAIRSMMWISLTFDHRVLDGLYGCGFLGALKKNLETKSITN